MRHKRKCEDYVRENRHDQPRASENRSFRPDVHQQNSERARTHKKTKGARPADDLEKVDRTHTENAIPSESHPQTFDSGRQVRIEARKQLLNKMCDTTFRGRGVAFGGEDRTDDPHQGAIGSVQTNGVVHHPQSARVFARYHAAMRLIPVDDLSLIHISEPTRLLSISYAVFCLKKKK